MHRRISIAPPEEKVGLLDRIAKKRDRSGLIDLAIRHYVEEAGKANLRRQLKEGYERRGARDLETAEAWFPLDDEGLSARNLGCSGKSVGESGPARFDG